MSVDVVRNPAPFAETVLRWYSPQETTPFALCGHIGPVLAQMDPGRHGSGVREVWFGDDGWEMTDGQALDVGDIRAFAIAYPPCDLCGGSGEHFEHAPTCDDDLCALNGDVHSCCGVVVKCSCR